MDWRYTKGLHELGNGLYAYLQPDGSWGWSNAGLIVDGDRSLLVDTLFDLRLTRDMLDAMRRATRAAESIDMLINTHANGDHWFGNELVTGAEIIAARHCAEEMLDAPPEALAELMAQAPRLGRLGGYLERIFGPFEFRGITPTLPTRTFDGELTLRVGSTKVRLADVGPAHTRSDTLVLVPAARTVFTADILFIGGHPVMWAGPVRNWIGALERILEMDVDVIVPGHGPITDKRGVAELKRYWEHLRDEARKRYEAGMSAMDAARDIPLDGFSAWGEAERLAVNVGTLFCEFAGDRELPNRVERFSMMAEMAQTVA